VKEETGLDIQIKSVLNVSSNFLSPNLHSLVITLRATVVNGSLIPGDDIAELKWFCKSEELPEMAFSADTFIIEYIKDNDIEEISLT
jgi:8-oxo-dGTP diphosphatase